MHHVDVLTIRGCDNAQAVLVNGTLVSCQGESDIGVGTLIEPACFFPALERALGGQRFHVLEHELNVALLRLDPKNWEWEEVIRKAHKHIARAVRKTAGARSADRAATRSRLGRWLYVRERSRGSGGAQRGRRHRSGRSRVGPGLGREQSVNDLPLKGEACEGNHTSPC